MIDKQAILNSGLNINSIKDVLPKGWKLLRLEKVNEFSPDGKQLWVIRFKKKNTPFAKTYGKGRWCEDIEIAIECARDDIERISMPKDYYKDFILVPRTRFANLFQISISEAA